MSGIEIVGIVLGSFPLICNSAKKVAHLLEKLESWWQFRNMFAELISAVATQEVAYTLLLKRLLATLQISQEEYESLLGNPQCTLWHEPGIRDGLQHRLSSDYEWFMGNLSDLNQAVLDLQQILLLDKLSQLDPASLEGMMFRIQTSFSSNKDRLLERITTTNDNLHKHLDRSEGVASQIAAKPKVSFGKLHVQAVAFYNCLVRHWQCSCSIPHTVGITVQPMALKSNPKDPPGYFDVVFETETKRKQLRIQVEAILCAASTQSPGASFVPKPGISIGAAVRLQGRMKMKIQQKHQPPMDTKSNEPLTMAPWPKTIPPESAQTRKTLLQRFMNKLQKPLRSSESRPVAIAQANVKSKHESASRLEHNQPSICSNTVLPDRSSVSQNSVSVPSRVRFADPAVPSLSAAQNLKNLKGEHSVDLCNLAAGSSCADGLVVDASRKVTFRPEPSDQSPLDISRQQTINAFLQTTLSVHVRILMGLRLALTILSLAPSAWVPQQLVKDHIFLVWGETQGKPIETLGPFFAKNSHKLQPMSNAEKQETWNARSTLLFLGIMLLELFHGETLESQASWAESLSPDGQPNSMTLNISALCWTDAARKSMKDFYGEDLGGGLHRAIRKCVCYDFDRDDDFGDSRFADLVYREVVAPLERLCPQSSRPREQTF